MRRVSSLREWDELRGGGATVRTRRSALLRAAYARLLAVPGPGGRRERAALRWCVWEDTHVLARARLVVAPWGAQYEDPAFRQVFARLVTHYWAHGCFLDDSPILAGMSPLLAGIPGVLIDGRLDISGPLDVPWQLSQVWPDSELVLIGDAAHTGSDAMTEAIVAATDRFAARP